MSQKSAVHTLPQEEKKSIKKIIYIKKLNYIQLCNQNLYIKNILDIYNKPNFLNFLIVDTHTHI